MLDRRRLAIAGLWSATLATSPVLYASEHALEHMLWHLAYGGAFGLILGAAWMLARQKPTRHASLWAWTGYAYMIVPDLIWATSSWTRGPGSVSCSSPPWPPASGVLVGPPIGHARGSADAARSSPSRMG